MEFNTGDYEEAILPYVQQSRLERIMTPRFVLVIFTALNFVTYYDRGAISGCLSTIMEKGGISPDADALSDSQSGLIVSCFMIGYMVSCPIFVAFGGTLASKWLIVIGMLVWGLACVGTGLSTSYEMLLACRVFVGVGEAAFVGFSVAIVERIAPENFRILWIGTFYSMIPLGTAAGMTVGGVLSALGTVGSTHGWRLVFFTEVMAATPIVISVALFPSKYNIRQEDDTSKYIPVHTAAFKLIKNLNYLLVVFGYAIYTFAIGSLAVWIIPFLVRGPMQLSLTTASLIMGGTTALTGVFGSVAGGVFMDLLGGNEGKLGIMKIQLSITFMIVICIPLGIIAIFMTHLWLFVPFLILCIFALFAVTAPLNSSILNVVPVELKAYAVSYSVLLIHLLGDLPSPVFTGFLSERFSGGCEKHKDDLSCMKDVANTCQWVNATSDATASHCVSETQLRNALLVVFNLLFLAAPAWLAVYFIVRCSYRRSLESTRCENGPSEDQTETS